ncbi:hypothetical protein [Nocardioides houyundeii]|uniref:hypothetical protein n=1 Tax=Nocardioides houyundeii TaxID=2045452 RepID=UPI000C76D921|nr:hypothetical protein [Nocardioides houyundeii]
MTSLQVADDEAWRTALGVTPDVEAVSGDEYVRELVYPVTGGEAVHLTWDVTDNSVRVRHRRGGEIVTDLHRETATVLTVAGAGKTAEILLEYGSAGHLGRTRVRLAPEVLIEDTFLRS